MVNTLFNPSVNSNYKNILTYIDGFAHVYLLKMLSHKGDVLCQKIMPILIHKKESWTG